MYKFLVLLIYFTITITITFYYFILIILVIFLACIASIGNTKVTNIDKEVITLLKYTRRYIRVEALNNDLSLIQRSFATANSN